MPRKKNKPLTEAVVDSAPIEPQEQSTAIAERPTDAAAEVEAPNNTPTTDGTGKNYGPPYKAIFTSHDKGFELGENRRFKQRVFTFNDKPDEPTIAALKQNGFTYRPAEKAWTTEATAESRVLTDRLARQFAGNESSMSRG